MGDKDMFAQVQHLSIIPWSSNHCTLHMFRTVALIYTKMKLFIQLFHFQLLACICVSYISRQELK